MPRQVEQFEFSADDLGPLVERMTWLSASRDGWVNLLPGVPSDLLDEQAARPSVLSALFGSSTLPVSMATWMPPGSRGRREVVTVGLMHDRGRHAVRQLQGFGVEVPVGWRVRQDHPRRGLVLLVPPGAAHDEVARWLLRAGERLAAVPLTGRWQARVYLPRSSTS